MQRRISLQPEQVRGEKTFDVDEIGLIDFFQTNNRERHRNRNRTKSKFNARNPVDTAIWRIPPHPRKNDAQDELADPGVAGKPCVHRQRHQKQKSEYYPDMLDFATNAGAIKKNKTKKNRATPGNPLLVKMPKFPRGRHLG